MRTAAVAARYGLFPNPLSMLGLDPYDWAIAVEVVNETQTLYMEQRTAELKSLAEAIGVTVGRNVGKAVSAAIAAMNGR